MAFEVGSTDQNGHTGYAHRELLRRIMELACGLGRVDPPTFAGAGDGALTGVMSTPDTITETWTVECTAVAVGGGTFSVAGSISGAQPDATVGVPYSNDFLSFEILAGAADFELGDTFTIGATASASTLPPEQRWTLLDYIAPAAIGQRHYLYLRGPGLSGDRQIYVGFQSYESVAADVYNIAVGGFIGHVPGLAWDSQPGVQTRGLPNHNQFCRYWLAVDGQRILLGYGVGSPVVYESGGVGFFLPYARPGQYGYPMFVAGMLNGTPNTRYSDTTHSMPWKGARVGFVLRDPAGAWVQPTVWPWSNTYIGGAQSQLRDTNGNYPVLALQLYSGGSLWGQLDGLGYVSNFNNTVESAVQVGGTPVTDNPAWSAPERVDQIIGAGGVPWVCLQDVARTSFNDYFALRML